MDSGDLVGFAKTTSQTPDSSTTSRLLNGMQELRMVGTKIQQHQIKVVTQSKAFLDRNLSSREIGRLFFWTFWCFLGHFGLFMASLNGFQKNYCKPLFRLWCPTTQIGERPLSEEVLNAPFFFAVFSPFCKIVGYAPPMSSC